jgi:hypothetical protein
MRAQHGFLRGFPVPVYRWKPRIAAGTWTQAEQPEGTVGSSMASTTSPHR